jgi:tRNA-dihydrouridine synthase B
MVQMTADIVKATHLPVTVKTRLGWDDNTKNIVEVAERLQDIGIQALSVHGRTRVQMYKGSADWTLIGKIKENPRMHIPVFGNGDIDSPEKALEYKNRYGVDGVMIGRAAIGAPWFFNEVKHFFKTGEHLPPPDMMQRVNTTRKHLDFSIRWKGVKLGIFEMRRHYTNYFKGLADFKPYRMRMVEANTAEEVYQILDEVVEVYSKQEMIA